MDYFIVIVNIVNLSNNIYIISEVLWSYILKIWIMKWEKFCIKRFFNVFLDICILRNFD